MANSEDTEVIADTEKVGVSLRDSLESKFDADDESDRVEPTSVELEEDDEEDIEDIEELDTEETETQTDERVAVAPPGDMNNAEREAFLNPTQENAHVLQSYLSRRAYETRSHYQREAAKLNEAQKRINGFYETIKEYEPEYLKQGIQLTDVARRSIEWDRAMKADPVDTAIQWLEAYGLSLDDLYNHQYTNGEYQQQAQPEYLTREEAEEIAQGQINQLLQQQQESALVEQNYNAVQSFISSKPLFRDPGTAQQLEEAMAPIVAALSERGGTPQEILETAYNYVTKGNPTFAGLSAKLEAPVNVEQKVRAAQKAKSATKSISGSTGSGTPALKAKNLRENLQRRFGGE